jgi:streptogrisin C
MIKVTTPVRQRRLLALALCVLAAVALLAALPTPRAQGAPASGPSVRLLAATDPAVVSLARERGISLGAAQTRLAWQEQAGPLSDELERALRDRFGGVWIDQASGRVKVATTAAPGAAAQARSIVARLGMGAVVDLVSVRHSYPYLYAVSDTLGADVLRANAGAPAPLVTGLATDRNAVVLILPQGRALTPSQQRFVANAQRTYGTAVVLERSATAYTGHKQACRYFYDYLGLACDPPLRGGVFIDNPDNPISGECTAGFIARSRSDNKPYLMTAGHCGKATWRTEFYDGSWHTIGTTWGTPRDDAEGDYQIITIDKPGPDGWAIRAWVYVSSSPDRDGIAGTTYDPDYYISGTSGTLLWDRVCVTGAWSLSSCGEVQMLNATAPWGLRHTVFTNNPGYCAQSGDSGAPVYVGHKARGIHIGGVTGCGNHWFQPIGPAENGLNVNVAHGT